MKESTHPFMVSMHSLEAKIEQLTREFKVRQIPVSSFWIMLILSSYLRLVRKQLKTGGKKG